MRIHPSKEKQIMKNINTKISTRGIFLGASLLGATVVGSVSSAQAAPQNQRHDVREARQNVREERRDLRDARQNLRVERRDLRNDYRPAPAFINSNRTLEGRVSNDLKDNGVLLRVSNGQDVRVTFANGEPKQLGTGDIIRVSGNYSGNGFFANNVTIIRNN